MICLLIRLSELSSCLQLKYLGKLVWMNANAIKNTPMILRCNSILGAAIEDGHEWGELTFPKRRKACGSKAIFPDRTREKMSEPY